jgi:cytochrome P450
VFDKGSRMNTIFRDAMGGGIFAVDGEQWYKQRKIMSRLFTTRTFRDSIAMCVKKYTIVLGRVLDRAAMAPEVPVDLGQIFPRYTFDVFAEVAFGLEEKSLESNDRHEFFDAANTLGRSLESRFHQPDWLWQLKRALGIGEERVLAAAITAIDKIVYRVIGENLQLKNDRQNQNGKKRATTDVISLFLANSDLLEEHSDSNTRTELSRKLLRDLCASVLLAGKDTTAITMSWLVIMLNRAPEVEDKIHQELREVLPRLFSDPSFVPTMDDVGQLVYLEAAMRESLRLNPVVPLNAKEANSDTTLCDGTVVKEGTRVYIPSYALGRMESVWGPDAAEYKPERWIEVDKSTGKYRRANYQPSMPDHGSVWACASRSSRSRSPWHSR